MPEYYPEHLMTPLPARAEICPRCKRGLLFNAQDADVVCMTCSGKERGPVFVRLDFVLETLALGAEESDDPNLFAKLTRLVQDEAGPQGFDEAAWRARHPRQK